MPYPQALFQSAPSPVVIVGSSPISCVCNLDLRLSIFLYCMLDPTTKRVGEVPSLPPWDRLSTTIGLNIFIQQLLTRWFIQVWHFICCKQRDLVPSDVERFAKWTKGNNKDVGNIPNGNQIKQRLHNITLHSWSALCIDQVMTLLLFPPETTHLM